MKYKAIILDLDGTTVPLGSPQPSNRVISAIAAAQKKIHVCVATGRPLLIAKEVIRKLQLTGICSVHDSTQLYDAGKDAIVDTVLLNHSLADKVYAILKQYTFQRILIGNGEQEYAYAGGDWPEGLSDITVPDIPESITDELIEKLTKIANIAVHKNVSFQKGLYWVSAVGAQATKLHAVVRISELLNISTKEIIGVGDSYNDFPLLEACGFRIAMGNAVPSLKDIADFVAPSVDEDGVATVIEKLILHQ